MKLIIIILCGGSLNLNSSSMVIAWVIVCLVGCHEKCLKCYSRTLFSWYVNFFYWHWCLFLFGCFCKPCKMDKIIVVLQEETSCFSINFPLI